MSETTNIQLLQQLRESNSQNKPTTDLIKTITGMMERIISDKDSFRTMEAENLIDLKLAKSRIFDEDPEWCLWRTYKEESSNNALSYFRMLIVSEMLRQSIANKYPRTCKIGI
jgi:hypothetical protein